MSSKSYEEVVAVLAEKIIARIQHRGITEGNAGPTEEEHKQLTLLRAFIHYPNVRSAILTGLEKEELQKAKMRYREQYEAVRKA